MTNLLNTTTFLNKVHRVDERLEKQKAYVIHYVEFKFMRSYWGVYMTTVFIWYCNSEEIFISYKDSWALRK